MFLDGRLESRTEAVTNDSIEGKGNGPESRTACLSLSIHGQRRTVRVR